MLVRKMLSEVLLLSVEIVALLGRRDSGVEDGLALRVESSELGTAEARETAGVEEALPPWGADALDAAGISPNAEGASGDTEDVSGGADLEETLLLRHVWVDPILDPLII